MATYLILNSVFLLVVLSALLVMRAVTFDRATLFTLLVILIATAIFDSLIVWAEIVAYDDSLISGLRVGHAPVEDFFYAVLAVILVPSIWRLTKRRIRE